MATKGPERSLESASGQFPKEEAVKAASEQSKAVRTPEETRKLREKLRFVAKVLSENYKLRFIPGNGWAAGLSEKATKELAKNPDMSVEDIDESLLIPEIMQYPEKDLLERSEDYIFGVFRHELSHIKHSDYRALIEQQRLGKKEGYSPQDFFLIYDAWEDGRSNNLESQTSRTAKARLAGYLEENYAELLQEDLEKRPLPVQYALLTWAHGAKLLIEDLNLENYTGKISDARVLEAYEKTKEALDEYLYEKKGLTAFREPFVKKGLPIFKDLIDKFIEEEAQRQASKNAGKPGQEQQEGQGSGGQSQPDQQPDQQPSEGQGQSGNEHDEQQKQEGQDSGSEQGAQDQDAEGEDKDQAEGADKQTTQDIWDQLSDQEKEAYRKIARQVLDDAEEEIIKILQPASSKIVKNPDGTWGVEARQVAPEAIKEADQQAAREALEEKRAQAVNEKELQAERLRVEAQLKEARERRTGLTDEQRARYEMYAEPVKRYSDRLLKDLDEMFPPVEPNQWEQGRLRGKRITRNRMAREIASKRGKMMEQKEIPRERRLAFSLLIDTSASMRMGNKNIYALEAALLMAESLEKKKIPFEINSFNSRFYEIKRFNEPYFGKKKIELLGMLEQSGGTDLGFSVDFAAERLRKQMQANRAQGALIVFTDGDPAPDSDHEGPEWELGAVVERWSRRLPVIGVGIGRGMETTISHYFKKSGLTVPDVSKLPTTLLKVLKRQAERFARKTS
jgi:uncharacterized protein YegL